MIGWFTSGLVNKNNNKNNKVVNATGVREYSPVAYSANRCADKSMTVPVRALSEYSRCPYNGPLINLSGKTPLDTTTDRLLVDYEATSKSCPYNIEALTANNLSRERWDLADACSSMRYEAFKNDPSRNIQNTHVNNYTHICVN